MDRKKKVMERGTLSLDFMEMVCYNINVKNKHEKNDSGVLLGNSCNRI